MGPKYPVNNRLEPAIFDRIRQIFLVISGSTDNDRLHAMIGYYGEGAGFRTSKLVPQSTVTALQRSHHSSELSKISYYYQYK